MTKANDDFTQQFTRLKTDVADQLRLIADKLSTHENPVVVDDPVVAQAALDMAALADQVEKSNANLNPAVPAPATTVGPSIPAAQSPTPGPIAPPPASNPSIALISPASGPVGSTVTVSGAGFGNSQNASVVTVGGIQVTPTSWTDTSFLVAIPGAPLGLVDVLVSAGGQTTKGTFTITA
jgi:hypothetical protein